MWYLLDKVELVFQKLAMSEESSNSSVVQLMALFTIILVLTCYYWWVKRSRLLRLDPDRAFVV